ncbi:MAG: hypothetical protein JEZ08_18000 [Clostridiales bacterium]|nr:hypothetical protein [Clostridiales bacterium]
MLKKILIGVMIVIVLFSSVAFYAYKKLEAQFESFIMAEVERQQAQVAKALEDKMEAATAEAELIAEAATIKMEAERSNAIIGAYFADIRNTHPNGKDFELEPLIITASDEETDQEIESNDSIQKTNDSTQKTETTTNVQITTATQIETSSVSNTQTIETKVEEKEEVEVYTKKDFDRDKKIAMELAMSRLTASQISRLIDISSGGFSPEEKQEAKDMFYSNFTAEEQNWILDIYTKYYFLVSEG